MAKYIPKKVWVEKEETITHLQKRLGLYRTIVYAICGVVVVVGLCVLLWPGKKKVVITPHPDAGKIVTYKMDIATYHAKVDSGLNRIIEKLDDERTVINNVYTQKVSRIDTMGSQALKDAFNALEE